MVVTYTITIKAPRVGIVQLDVDVHRSCPLGDNRNLWTITTLGQAATIGAAVLAWIAADVATLTAQVAINATNATIKAAFETAVGPLQFTVTI